MAMCACAMIGAMGLSLALKQQALDSGFDLVGVAPLAVWDDLQFARRWFAKGFAGEMRYLGNPARYDPRLILPSAKSVICVGLVYNTAFPYSTQVSKAEGSTRESRSRGAASFESRISRTSGGREEADPGSRAWISRYAWGKDYHAVMRAKLERLRMAVEAMAPGSETRAFVDTGPVVERAFARHSRLGWMGKNTCIINEAKGSWFFLGVMLTSLELEPDLPAPDRCGSCMLCLEACPTGALVQPYVMDASRCISYLTIELKGAIPRDLRSAIGANVFGCDICQDVCPWNSKGSGQLPVVSNQKTKITTTSLAEFEPRQVLVGEGLHGPPANVACRTRSVPAGARRAAASFSLFNPPLEALTAIAERDFQRLLRHSPIRRAKYRGWLRNLCVAMGNSGDLRFIPKLKVLSQDPDAFVREHAEWALKTLRLV